MLQVTHPKQSLRIARPRPRRAPLARCRVEARTSPAESNAAPLTLAAVVVTTLLLALTTAIVTALGG